MSIDVEGLNEEIVNSIDFSKCRPSVFCLETLEFSVTNKPNKISSIINIMLKNDYLVYAETNLNTIFIDKTIW